MTLYPGFAELYHDQLPDRIRRYLNARGIPDPTIEQAQLGWNGERITIPVYDREGRLVLYKLGRAPDDSTGSPKMFCDPPGVKAELYGWDSLTARPSSVIVCEGEYDRLVLEARDFPAVTGTAGALVFREEWALEITKVPMVYVCFDNDDAGRRGTERVSRLIPTAKVMTLPPAVGQGGDVTDFFVHLGRSRNDFLRLLSTSAPLPVAEKHSALLSQSISRPGSNGGHSDIRRLKEAVRIEEIIRQYIPLRRSGRALMGLCYFHEDHVPSLAVFPDTQSFHCFGCQKHGDVITFLMEAEHLNFSEAVRILKRSKTLAQTQRRTRAL